MEKLQASREAKLPDRPGLFKEMEQLLVAKDQKLTDDELVAESSTLFFAGGSIFCVAARNIENFDRCKGTDTTASTIAFSLWHLLHDKDSYTRLQRELETVMPETTSRPTLKQLEALPFLEACIKEGLRVTCAPRGRLPRVVPSDGLRTNGHFVPPGVSPTQACPPPSMQLTLR
jgi:cytochrome P450